MGIKANTWGANGLAVGDVSVRVGGVVIAVNRYSSPLTYGGMFYHSYCVILHIGTLTYTGTSIVVIVDLFETHIAIIYIVITKKKYKQKIYSPNICNGSL